MGCSRRRWLDRGTRLDRWAKILKGALNAEDRTFMGGRGTPTLVQMAAARPGPGGLRGARRLHAELGPSVGARGDPHERRGGAEEVRELLRHQELRLAPPGARQQ